MQFNFYNKFIQKNTAYQQSNLELEKLLNILDIENQVCWTIERKKNQKT